MNGIMMPPTHPGTSTNAGNALRDYTNLAIQVRTILSAIADLKSREAEHAYSTIYANTPTYALNPDGTPGADDPTPVSTHPMINTSISVNTVDAFNGYIVNDVYNFLTGVAGPTVADRRPALYGMLP